MRDDRMPGAAAGAAVVLGLALAFAVPAAAQVAGSEEVYRQNALGHADAVMRAYRRLEQHILEESTALTDGSTWAGSVPPAATGWLADWTQRGVRARYCDDTLLVYLDPARLKGVGADHRAVQVALRLYVPGRNRGATGPGLHWLENGIVRDVGGSAVVPLPACLSTPALPSGRPAFAGGVRDPFATANLRQRRSTEVMDPPQACAAGEHGPGRTMFREVVETLNDRNEVVGRPTFGSWQVLVDGCRADYTVTERFTRECVFQAGPPHDRQLTGIEVWQRTRTVTQGGGRLRSGAVRVDELLGERRDGSGAVERQRLGDGGAAAGPAGGLVRGRNERRDLSGSRQSEAHGAVPVGRDADRDGREGAVDGGWKHLPASGPESPGKRLEPERRRLGMRLRRAMRRLRLVGAERLERSEQLGTGRGSGDGEPVRAVRNGLVLPNGGDTARLAEGWSR